MFDFLTRLFDTSDVPARWESGQWSASLGWLHILPELFICGAYVAILGVLGYFLIRRKDVPFPRVFWLFAAFIFACGGGHLVEAILFWRPIYEFAGLLKLVTAIISWAVVIALVPVVRHALTMRSPAELEKANRLLSESEERTRQIIDTAYDAFIAMDVDGTITGWNRQAEATFGWTRDEAIGRKLVDTIISQSLRYTERMSLSRYLTALDQQQQSRRVEIMVLHRDGREFPVELTISPMHWRGTLNLLAFVHDLTDRKQADQRFRQLLESAPDAMVIVNGTGCISLVNAQAENVFGYRREDLLGADVEILIHERSGVERLAPTEAFALDPPIRRMQSGGEIVGHRKDGREFPVEISLSPIETDTGQLIVVVIRDITERKQVEAALMEKNRQLLQSERLAAIGEMVTGLAHESRNALQRSQACLDMLVHRIQDQPKALELAERIQHAQNRLQHLYEQVREYAAPIHLKREHRQLDEIVDAAWRSLHVTWRDRQVIFDQRIGDFDLTCNVDVLALEQVFRNLFENSLSVCADPVEVQIQWSLASLSGRAAWQASVRDNGPGFARELRDKVFQPFFTTKTKGTGLGLPITKRIIESHGGTLELGADGRSGAEIVITIPRELGDVA